MANGGDPVAAPLLRLGGMTLEQHAGVTAALAEGFTLDAAMANERLEVGLWRLADTEWKARVTEDGLSSALFGAYRAKLEEAEEWLTRSVRPLEDDFAAWVAFVRAWDKHPAPFDMLAAIDLRMSDVARLQRRWGQRVKSEPALVKQFRELWQKDAGELPRVVAAPAQLRPFPWSPGPAVAPARSAWSKGDARRTEAPALDRPAPAPGVASMLDVSFYRYVAAKARVAEEPGNEESALEKLGYVDFARVDAAWQARLEKDAALASDYRRLLQHERERLRATMSCTESALPTSGPAPVPAAQPAAPGPRAPHEVAGASLDVGRAARDFGARRLSIEIPRDLPPPRSVAARQPSRPPAPSLRIDTPAPGFTPAPARPWPAPPLLTLEQHASLCAELARSPAHTAAILARYGLTPDAKVALDAHYRGQVAADPALRERWQRAYQSYQAWMMGTPGR
jgi:hypothetical protein